jgi:hypothetical protein
MKSLIGLAAEAEPMARRHTLRQAKRRRRWDNGEAFMRIKGEASRETERVRIELFIDVGR